MLSITLDSKDGIRPDTFDMRELGLFIVEVSNLMAKADPAGDAKAGLASIEPNCIKLNINLLNRRAVRVLSLLWFYLSGANVTLPLACNAQIDFINGFVKRNNLTISVPGRHGSGPLHVSAVNPIRKMEARKMRYTTSIYGELMDVGGVTPNAHIKPVNGEKQIRCQIDRDMAIALGERLYSVVGLRGEATSEDGVITDFKVSSILPYRVRPNQDVFVELRNSGLAEMFKDVDDPVAFVREMRG